MSVKVFKLKNYITIGMLELFTHQILREDPVLYAISQRRHVSHIMQSVCGSDEGYRTSSNSRGSRLVGWRLRVSTTDHDHSRYNQRALR